MADPPLLLGLRPILRSQSHLLRGRRLCTRFDGCPIPPGLEHGQRRRNNQLVALGAVSAASRHGRPALRISPSGSVAHEPQAQPQAPGGHGSIGAAHCTPACSKQGVCRCLQRQRVAAGAAGLHELQPAFPRAAQLKLEGIRLEERLVGSRIVAQPLVRHSAQLDAHAGHLLLSELTELAEAEDASQQCLAPARAAIGVRSPCGGRQHPRESRELAAGHLATQRGWAQRHAERRKLVADRNPRHHGLDVAWATVRSLPRRQPRPQFHPPRARHQLLRERLLAEQPVQPLGLLASAAVAVRAHGASVRAPALHRLAQGDGGFRISRAVHRAVRICTRRRSRNRRARSHGSCRRNSLRDRRWARWRRSRHRSW